MADRSSLRILVACEFSGTVRNAFLAEGYDAWSCDLLPAEDGSNRHIRGDARDLLDNGWDLLFVAHPPCTRLCNSGVRWLDEPPTNAPEAATDEERSAWPMLGREARLAIMWRLLDEGAALFSAFWNAPIERIAIENPVMHRHAKGRIVDFRPPAQTVQPWWFGEPFFKATGLYLRNLPPLIATNRLTPPSRGTAEHKAWSRVHRMPPGPNRAKERSRFFAGIAEAMAAQWGGHAFSQIRRAA
ncbi:hypothetical protein [Mycoplana ramosa]|uniref:DNA cytosine methyltransferase n=1 Tax=Mycoplana ramosa TaxID=40837 RepID=A0ABW3YWI0_MYCRA